ncbi:hypothetical protein COV15_03020 [Candidatus Woesearchaeota archaeon CG10_big_fil_rev_8_21_14_0_10_34_12]|nr:MAG: hypothetical protein COV15_03020 [Candidatus Woesearchaeota archaeon CG10_big_fil_rev_8_21_14_0_10_34_12]
MKEKTTQEIKQKARRSLPKRLTAKKGDFVLDTSAIIYGYLPNLLNKKIEGKIIIPNAVMAELENLANKGIEVGFKGLEEITKIHKHGKNIKILFEGPRPQENQIKFAKSGEIDALIRDIAVQNKACLITADLVQAKSAQAYGLEVLFIPPKPLEKPKKKFLWFWRR